MATAVVGLGLIAPGGGSVATPTVEAKARSGVMTRADVVLVASLDAPSPEELAWQQIVAEHEAWIAAVEAEQARLEAERAATEAAAAAAARVWVPTGTVSTAGPSYGSCAGDVACFLPCTRAHESDSAGGYSAVSSGGQYRGAYQFLQSTWDAAAAGAGHAEWVGVPPEQAPPEIQDAVAAHLYAQSGNRPWGGRC